MGHDSWFNLLGTIATWLAVIVAVCGDRIRLCLFKPTIRINEHAPDKNKITTSDGVQPVLNEELWYYHLAICNKRKTPAKNTIVYLTQIEEVISKKTKILVWEGEIPLTWHYGFLYKYMSRDIGSEQICDIISIGETSGIQVMTMVKPNNMPKYGNQEVHLNLTIKVKSDQTIVKAEIGIKWNGEWHGEKDKMSKNIELDIVNQKGKSKCK
jgi:hypothetical protein